MEDVTVIEDSDEEEDDDNRKSDIELDKDDAVWVLRSVSEVYEPD